MILFREADSAILKSDWYKAEKGFKAEAVTYTLALLRHALLEEEKDINLSRIYQNQCVPESLMNFIVSLAERVRNNITDPEFRGGVANPSEFCKSEKGWLRFHDMDIDLSSIVNADIISGDQIDDKEDENKALNDVSKSVSDFDSVMKVSDKEWELIAGYYIDTYGPEHINVGIPRACVSLHRYGKLPTDKQLKQAVQIREKAYSDGFDFVSG
jgi:hypothetical protein